jgi:hypothetical protein
MTLLLPIYKKPQGRNSHSRPQAINLLQASYALLQEPEFL